MIRFVITIFFAIVPAAAFSATQEELASLHKALKTDELMQVLSEEGIEQSNELRDEMFPGRGRLGWRLVVQNIYEPSRLDTIFRNAFDEALADTDVSEVLVFYTKGPGVEIADLELDARRAISSDEVEDAARQAYAELSERNAPRNELLEEFAELNKLIDRNVAGALNANLAFFRGLSSGEGFDVPEDQMLQDVWSREPEIREDTAGWIFGYMTFAFEPLSDESLRAYIDMSASEAGQDLNRALFAGFDALFQKVSFDIGAAAARFSVGEDL